MKLKKCFPGLLLPFGKDKNKKDEASKSPFKSNLTDGPEYTADEYLVFAILVIIALMLLGIDCFCYAQPRKPVAITIGEKVPDVTVPNVLNCPTKTIKLSQFRGKLLIIDFWSTNCGSCIEAMPRLDSLQHEFGNEVQILTVSYQHKDQLLRFFSRNNGRAMRLPVVTDDKILAAMFPHRMLSHEVWIGPDGMVRAITAVEYVNAANISAVLRHQPIDLPLKSDVLAYDYSKPLLNSGDPLYYSMVSAFKPGVAPKFNTDVDSLHHRLRMYVVNVPLLKMYMMAIGRLMYFPKTMMDIRVRDTALAYKPQAMYRSQWNERYAFCYEAVLPLGTSPAERLDLFRRDLNRYFGLNGHLEHRNAPCLALIRTDPGNRLMEPKGGKPVNHLHGPDGMRVMRNASLDNLIWEMNELEGGLPAVDHTGYPGKADLELNISSFRDLPQLNRALSRYGLEFRKETDDLEFFVLYDAQRARPLLATF